MEFEIMEVFGSFVEAVAPYFEAVQPHLVDIIVGSVLGVALISGLFKPWRGSLMALLFQWFCLGVSFLLARFMAPLVTDRVMGIEMVSGFFDGALGAAQLHQVLGVVILLALMIFLFALIGSLVFALIRNRDWDRLIFPKLQLHPSLSRILSALFTTLNVYTYVFFFLAIMSLPMFDVIGERSLAATARDANILGAPLAQTIAEPIENLYQAAYVLENELSDIVVGDQIQYDVVADIINHDPVRLAEIADSFQTLFPDIPDDVMNELWDFVLQEDEVTPQEVEHFFLTHMTAQ